MISNFYVMYIHMLLITLYTNNSICNFFLKKNLKYKTLSNGFNCFGTCLQNYTLERFFLMYFKVNLHNVKSYEAL